MRSFPWYKLIHFGVGFGLLVAASLTVLLDSTVLAAGPPLGRIALGTHDLPYGFRLVKTAPNNTHLNGFQSGATWTFGRNRAISSPGMFWVSNSVVKYDNRVDAAQGALVAFARQCGSKQSNFAYHLLEPAIGDFSSGCYYPESFHHMAGARVVAVALRRFSYVLVVRAYFTPASNQLALNQPAFHLVGLVDRRVELYGGKAGSSRPGTKPPSGRSLTILRCSSKNCLFRATGRGSTMYAGSFGATPRAWRFSPPPLYTVHYKFDCGHVSHRAESFYLTELDELNARVILRGTSDQRNIGTLTASLPFGARHAVLLVQVENNSCSWSVKATRR